MKLRIDPADADLFRDVVFLIEADDYARSALWREYSHESREMGKRQPSLYGTTVGPVVQWEQECRGHGIHVGNVGELPTVVSITYAKLNGKRVMFYYGCSLLVHHGMIDEWLKHWTLKTVRWDGGSRWAHCNATNFHHCLDAIGALDEYRAAKDLAG